MPSYTRGRKRDQIRAVGINDLMYYGFMTTDLGAGSGISDAEIQSQLGQVSLGTIDAPASPTTGTLVIFGANAPKPTRMTKRLSSTVTATTRSQVSTFCSYDSITTAINAGWKVAKTGRIATFSETVKSATAGINIGGVVYVFSMNKTDFATYGTDLGLVAAESITGAEAKRMVRGTSRPRPGRATKKIDTGESFTCYYDPTKLDNLIAAGWSNISTATF